MPPIREATVDDIGPITAVIRAAFAEYEGRLDPPSSAHGKSEATVRAELADGSAFVYEQDGAIVGCVFLHPHDDHMYLDRLSVLPTRRRQGIAQDLMAAVEQRARERGYHRVQLSVRLSLAENRAYYERVGYRFLRYGTHAGYSAPTFVVMEKVVVMPDVDA
jgi:predicted N-acetyltransferase YhbS